MFKFTLTDMTVTKGRRLSWAGCIQVQHCTAKMGTKMTQLYSKWKHWHGSLASHKGSPRSCTGVSTVELRPKIRNRTHEDILFQFCTHGLVLSEIFDHLLVLEPAEDKVTSLLLQIHASVKLSSKIIGGACCTLGKDYVKQNQQAILAMVFSKLLASREASVWRVIDL